jgi:hypothetical protein
MLLIGFDRRNVQALPRAAAAGTSILNREGTMAPRVIIYGKNT